VAGELQGAGYEVELDAWHWGAGESIMARINQALEQSQVVALFSAAYFDPERWTTKEWTAAQAAGNKLIPLRIEDATAPPTLRDLIAPALYGLDENEARNVLLSAVAGRTGPPLVPPGFPGVGKAGKGWLLVDALRMLLFDHGVTLVRENRTKSLLLTWLKGLLLTRLKKRCDLAGHEKLIGYLKPGVSINAKNQVAFTDTHLYVLASRDVVKAPYSALEDVSLSTSSKLVRWGGGTDQGFVGGEDLVFTTTVAYKYRKVEFKGEQLMQEALRTFLPAMADLRKRHP
jgi:hypothetical protein